MEEHISPRKKALIRKLWKQSTIEAIKFEKSNREELLIDAAEKMWVSISYFLEALDRKTHHNHQQKLAAAVKFSRKEPEIASLYDHGRLLHHYHYQPDQYTTEEILRIHALAASQLHYLLM